jgi:YggT family protein
LLLFYLFQLYKIMQYLAYLLRLIFGVIIILLGLRFFLRFFSANPFNPFVEFIYSVTYNILFLFRGIFPTQILAERYVVEYSTLFAIIIFSLLAHFAGILFFPPAKDETVIIKDNDRGYRK